MSNITSLLTREQLQPGKCYECVGPNGETIKGTLETLQAVSLATTLTVKPDGIPVPHYDSETKFYWETQTTVTKDGQRIWLTAEGDEIPENELLYREKAA